MIYRVGDNEIKSYDYNSIKTHTTGNDSEKFSLEHGQQNLPDEEKKEEKDQVKRTPTVKTFDHGSIKLELSGYQNPSSGKRNQSGQGEKTEKGTLEKILGFDLIGMIKEIGIRIQNLFQKVMDFVWNDTEGDAESTAENQDASLDGEYTDGIRPEKSVRSKKTVADEKTELLNEMTDYGKRKLAKHYPMLTYYDRNGQYKDISASDKERILHGEKNTTEL